MATIEQASKALQATHEMKGLRSLIEQQTKELGKALPEHLSPERMVRIALTCLRTNPELTKCTPESFLGALFTAAQVGIEPVGGRAYLLPFNNSRKKPDGSWHTVKECQFVLGYRGVAELFYRNSKAIKLDWGIVREGDDFTWQEGTDQFIQHRPKLNNKAPAIAYYAIATLKHDAKIIKVMSADECLEHGKQHSKSYDKKAGHFRDNSPWATDRDAMSLKTVLVQLSKLLPMSVELQRAALADETSRDYRKGFGDVFDMPDTTNWSDAPLETPAPKDPDDPGEPPMSGEADAQIEFGSQK